MEEIINRVANSGLITIDLETFYAEGERVQYDIKEKPLARDSTERKGI